MDYYYKGEFFQHVRRKQYNDQETKSNTQSFYTEPFLTSPKESIQKKNKSKMAIIAGSLLTYGNGRTYIRNNLKVAHVNPKPELPLRTRVSKRLFDLAFSVFVMILGFPMFLLMSLITKLTSQGPIFYNQERIGKHEKAFKIYKFRSMRVDAEKAGPQLSNRTDPRITKWGRVIRRTRLDELPQFWNVLKGDMSIVGPRPERRYFIDKIIEKSPDYINLHHLKPGITSLGQVNFGYAEDVDEMCIRMKHDLDYLQSINLKTDLSVIFKTIMVMISCKGK